MSAEFAENSSATLPDPVNFTVSISLFTLSDCDNGSPGIGSVGDRMQAVARDTSWYYQRSKRNRSLFIEGL